MALINPAVAAAPAAEPHLRRRRSARATAPNQSLSRHLQEARWLLRSIEQRFATIQRVADAIVARQRGFFEYGEVAMKPLDAQADRRRARPARVDGVPRHQRQVHGDAARPVRVQALLLAPPRHRERRRGLGHRGARGDEGADRARGPARAAVGRASSPASSAQQGLRVARRTITKYRALMRMPSVELRRAMARTAAA